MRRSARSGGRERLRHPAGAEATARGRAAEAKRPPDGVRLTHPDRVLFADMGLSKADLIEYYRAVERFILPHVSRRLLSLVRCPQGTERKCFYQKHSTEGFPGAFRSLRVHETSGGERDYFYINGFAGLAAGVQVGTLEFHVWGSPIEDIERPTRMVFDLDPDPAVDFTRVRAAAFEIRDYLAGLGLATFPMLTGGKGIHVVAPLTRSAEWPTTKAFAHAVAHTLVETSPDRYVAEASKAKRRGRIFIDYLRNDRGSTAVVPYSTRAKRGAPVASPVSWRELESVESAAAYEVTLMMRRIARLEEDPWAGYASARQSLTKALLARAGIG
jgi:bifunctional non-homologous end joining protein LigD